MGIYIHFYEMQIPIFVKQIFREKNISFRGCKSTDCQVVKTKIKIKNKEVGQMKDRKKTMIMVMSIVIAFAIVGGIAIYGECQKAEYMALNFFRRI